MTETVEGVAKYKGETVSTKGKDPVKIRISLFYDGTLNNRMNIEEREKNSQIYKDNKTKDANSYDNGRTNIAIMEPHVEETADGYDFFFKKYIAGQGALTHESDSFWGYALAIGKSGVPGRAEEGIREAVNFIFNQKDNINTDEHYIQKLTIDVFGFSRGAATARYAIHVIKHGRISSVDDVTGEVTYEWRPLLERINDFYIILDNAVEVKFAGLYDTVLSYFGSQKVSWTTNALQQMAVARANKTLHLAAADEHRSDFPLHKILSAVNQGVGEEYYLPGVHSDVGGSYNTASELDLKKDIDDDKKVYMTTSNEGTDKSEFNWLGNAKGKTMVINEGDPGRLKQDRKDLIAQGWFKENEINMHDVSWTMGENGERIVQTSVLTVAREGIRSAYCNIPLKIMADYARKPDVKLKIDSKLEVRANRILRDEQDLKNLEEIIVKYIAANKNNSKPEDWKPEDWKPDEQVGKKTAIDRDVLKAIRYRHFHFSASKWSAGYKPNFKWDEATQKYKRIREYYDA
jgi:hypothetical protein